MQHMTQQQQKQQQLQVRVQTTFFSCNVLCDLIKSIHLHLEKRYIYQKAGCRGAGPIHGSFSRDPIRLPIASTSKAGQCSRIISQLVAVAQQFSVKLLLIALLFVSTTLIWRYF